ncbi:MAG TPA: formate dehydrogenase subunit gamma [Acidisphaera sp.]|nr:formate dehydrogenase subunit gamma [Acidisphaera sp.]
MSRHEGWSAERARAVIDSHAGEDGAMLPVLHDLQAMFGYIPHEAVPLVADALNVSRAEVRGVVSFYHDFRDHPPGRHVLRLCRAEACQSVGGVRVADHARARFGIDWHETTADGALTLEPVYCLGLCACGPSAMLDETPIARLDEAQIDALIEAAR